VRPGVRESWTAEWNGAGDGCEGGERSRKIVVVVPSPFARPATFQLQIDERGKFEKASDVVLAPISKTPSPPTLLLLAQSPPRAPEPPS